MASMPRTSNRWLIDTSLCWLCYSHLSEKTETLDLGDGNGCGVLSQQSPELKIGQFKEIEKEEYYSNHVGGHNHTRHCKPLIIVISA